MYNKNRSIGFFVMTNQRKFWLFVILIIAIALTVKLGVIYYNANFNPYALSSFCSVNDYIDCDGVAQTTHSQFFGIPLFAWGMFFYFFIIFMMFVPKLKKIKFLSFLEVFKKPRSYIYSLGLLAFSISMILACVSIFEIKKICVLCFMTYFLNLLIAVIARTPGSGLLGDIKTSFIDFFEAVKVKKYLISFLLVCLAAISFLAYTTISSVFVPHLKKIKSIESFKNIKGNPYKSSGNQLGDKDAKIVINEFTDFQCPHCAILNLMLQRLVTEVSNVKVIHHNFPLDRSCNDKIINSPHKNSCKVALYAIAAEKQGKYWNLNNDLFSEDTLSEKEILQAAKKAGLDPEKLQKDANSPQTQKELQESIQYAYDLKLEGTPSMVIGAKVFLGIKPYYELKQMVIDMGAVEKK